MLPVASHRKTHIIIEFRCISTSHRDQLHSMYVSAFSCTAVGSWCFCGAFWVQICPAVRTEWTNPLTTLVQIWTSTAHMACLINTKIYMVTIKWKNNTMVWVLLSPTTLLYTHTYIVLEFKLHTLCIIYIILFLYSGFSCTPVGSTCLISVVLSVYSFVPLFAQSGLLL